MHLSCVRPVAVTTIIILASGVPKKRDHLNGAAGLEISHTALGPADVLGFYEVDMP
jgi:hypothetical protein